MPRTLTFNTRGQSAGVRLVNGRAELAGPDGGRVDQVIDRPEGRFRLPDRVGHGVRSRSRPGRERRGPARLDGWRRPRRRRGSLRLGTPAATARPMPLAPPVTTATCPSDAGPSLAPPWTVAFRIVCYETAGPNLTRHGHFACPRVLADLPVSPVVTELLAGRVELVPWSAGGDSGAFDAIYTYGHPTVDAAMLDRLTGVQRHQQLRRRGRSHRRGRGDGPRHPGREHAGHPRRGNRRPGVRADPGRRPADRRRGQIRPRAGVHALRPDLPARPRGARARSASSAWAGSASRWRSGRGRST